MTHTNPFFNHTYPGQSGEQGLIDDLVIEQIQMFGFDCLYMPRRMINLDKLLHEASKNAFEFAMPVPMYLKTFSGYNNGMEMLTKFGVRASDEMTLVMSRSVWNTSYAPFVKSYYNAIGERPPESELNYLEGETSRPKEGDLIYFPFDDGIFEVKYVQFDEPFFQLGRGYVYQLMCEKFEYSGESMETGYNEIDNFMVTPDYYRMVFDLEELSDKPFEFNEIVTLYDFSEVILNTQKDEDVNTELFQDIVVENMFRLYNDPGYLETVNTVTARVMNYNVPDKILEVTDLSNLDPDQMRENYGEEDDQNIDVNKFDAVIIVGSVSGARVVSLKAREKRNPGSDNEVIQEEFDDIKILDNPWDQNPFGFV